MDLQELLEVQVGHLLTVLRAEELGELGIRDDAALHVGVKAVVALDIGGDELGHIRLAALRLRGASHKSSQLIGDGAELQERVVRTTSLPRRTLLGGHRGGVLAHTALGVTSLTADRLCGIRRLTEKLTNTGRHLSTQRTEAVLDRGEEGIARASLHRCGRNGRSDRRRCRGGNRDINDRLRGRGLLGGGSLGGGRGLRGRRHRVYTRG